MRLTPSMLTLAAALAVAPHAGAANFDKDIPYANFTAADKAIFQQALDSTLDKGADGVTVSWDNPDTKARGDIRPTKSFQRAGSACRNVTISNHAKGRSASGPFTFCRNPAGKWGLANAAPGKAAAPKEK